MKKIIDTLEIVALIAIIVGGICCVSYRLLPKEREIHLFYEPYATMPALLEAIEFVKLPNTTSKIFAWHRFPHQDQKIDLKAIHATELEIPIREGAFYREKIQKVHRYILDIAKKDKESTFVIHANLDHTRQLVIPLLQELPKNRIKHIHLYEDGLCSVVQKLILSDQKDIELSPESFQRLKGVIENYQDFKDYKVLYEDIWSLSKLYPVTYHLGCENLYNQRLETLKKEIKIEFVDFRKTRQSLKQDQKELLWRLLDFDYNKYNRLLSHKNSFFFLGAYTFNNQNLRSSIRRMADDFQKGILMDLPKDLVWIYKPHPSYSAIKDLEYMQDLEGKWTFIPAQIPVEVFILAGLEPTYVAGYPSSAHYSFTDDHTALLLERPRYQKVLKELGIKADKFISLEKIQKLEEQKKD